MDEEKLLAIFLWLDSFFLLGLARALALVCSPSLLQALTFFPLLPSLQGLNSLFFHSL